MGQVDYGPQSLDRKVEAERRAALAAGIPPAYALAQKCALERAQEAEREALALRAARLEARAQSKLRASGSGYTGSDLTTEVLLEQQGPATVRGPNGKVYRVSRIAARKAKPARRKLTVGDYWDMIQHRVKAVYTRSKVTHGHQSTEAKGKRELLQRQGMKMLAKRVLWVTVDHLEDGTPVRALVQPSWPTRHVPGAIMRHKGDF